jgi:mRNA interferase MazF
MISSTKLPEPHRGEVWLVRFEPSTGAEIQNTRPAVVIDLEEVGRLPLRIAVPITDWKELYANYMWFVHLTPSKANGLTKVSGADAFQVKSVARERFTQRIGRLSNEEVTEIASAVALCIGVGV